MATDETESVMTFGDAGIEPNPDKPKRGRPKGSKNTGTTTGARRGRRAAVEPIKEGLRTIFGGVGLMLSAFPVTRQDAVIVATHSDPLVDALGDLAAQDRRVRMVLSKMVTGTAWGSVAFAAAGMVLPILSNHNLLPGPMGVLFSTDEEGKTNAEHMEDALASMTPEEANEILSTVSDATEGPSVAR